MKKIFTLFMIVMMLFGAAACSKESGQEEVDELQHLRACVWKQTRNRCYEFFTVGHRIHVSFLER